MGGGLAKTTFKVIQISAKSSSCDEISTTKKHLQGVSKKFFNV